MTKLPLPSASGRKISHLRTFQSFMQFDSVWTTYVPTKYCNIKEKRNLLKTKETKPPHTSAL